MIDATGMPQSALVIGGTSDIAVATLRLLTKRRLRRVLLAGRNDAALESVAKSLRDEGVEFAEAEHLDLAETSGLDDFARRARERLGEIDVVLVAAGILGTSELDELDAASVAESLTVNFSAVAAVTLALAKLLVAQGTGVIVVLSSVAAVRVRRATFVYGAAKAGLDGFAQGLGDALSGTGVRVTVVRPGFVRTKMTAGRTQLPFAVDAATVAAAIIRGLETRSEVVWVPPYLRWLFLAVRFVPRAIFRQIKR
ncbi:MAG: SDR family NAD(P)-dependent oxidoreductase [Acidimicrobiales bacterium]